MNNIYFFTLTILILVPLSVIPQTKVSSINFRSLSKTNPLFLKKFLELKEGDKFDSLKLVRDEQFLKNIQYYKDVSCSVNTSQEKTAVIFFLQEKTTVLPIVNFNYIRGNLLLRLGITDYNFLGSWNVLGGYYQYYDRNSFEIFQYTPYLFGTRLGVRTRYANYSTIEPAYFENGRSYFNVDRNVYGFLFSYDFSNVIGRGKKIILSLGTDFLEEIYNKNIERSVHNSPGPDYDNRQKLIFKSSLAIESVDYFFEQTDGYLNRVFYEIVSEKNDFFGFQKFLNDFRFYKNFNSKDNIALRIRFGISTNKNSPFIPFVIDNYINVRGIGDRVARGSGELTLNVEYRRTVLSLSWAAIQLVAFSDISAIRPGGSSLEKLFENQNIYSSAGTGIRIHLFDFYNVIFRLDYGINIKNPERGGIVIGMNQYF